MDEMVSGAKWARIAEEEEEHHEDHISRLPDAILGEIVSLLGTKDGGRTQAIASRWRHLWRSAPLNIDIHDGAFVRLAQISGILSSHRGPGRRFRIPRHYSVDPDDCRAARLDAWLRSPALDGLQELDFHYGSTLTRHWNPAPPPLPESARRFSSTLRVASFGGCAFRDENGGLHFPHLVQLSLLSVRISETSLNAMLAGCPLLQSLMMTESIGCKRVRIVSPTLRSIGICIGWDMVMLQQIIIEDAPSLERFLLLGFSVGRERFISIISAPKLKILGQLQCLEGPTMELGNSVFKGSSVVNSTTVLPSVKVLALTHISLSLDEVIAFMKCFPCLENLYIKISESYHHHESKESRAMTNAWRQKYKNLIGTLDIPLKKIVLSTYRGNKAHANFAAFFVLNARVLESMVLELDASKYHNKPWIEKQKTLLQIEERASRGAQFDFVYHFGRPGHSEQRWYEQVHDLSTADPYIGFDKWAKG